MATTSPTALFSFPSLRLPHRLLSPASRFQTLAAKKPVAPTVSGPSGGGGGGGGGLLSVLDRALADEEEYRRARAQVQRKGVEVEGYAIEGVSVGGHETCVTVPSLNVAFDIGRGPQFAVRQDYLFITHAHLDHIGGLPMYVATRALYNLKPPTVFVPPCIRDDVEELLQVHRRMSQDDLEVELVALDLGETYEIRNDLVARPFRTHHTIPSQGYVIYSVRKKLKKQYAHLKGNQIMKLKQSGAEITDTILFPEVAFTGDTKSDFILDPRNADALRAKILITEATFLDDQIDVDHAWEHGHMHLSEIMEHSQWFRNKAIILTHFSNRYSLEDIRQAVSRLQPKLCSKQRIFSEKMYPAMSLFFRIPFSSGLLVLMIHRIANLLVSGYRITSFLCTNAFFTHTLHGFIVSGVIIRIFACGNDEYVGFVR